MLESEEQTVECQRLVFQVFQKRQQNVQPNIPTNKQTIEPDRPYKQFGHRIQPIQRRTATIANQLEIQHCSGQLYGRHFENRRQL